jgi:hypothetical protein
MAAKEEKDKGAQFVRYFGTLLDALRGPGLFCHGRRSGRPCGARTEHPA